MMTTTATTLEAFEPIYGEARPVAAASGGSSDHHDDTSNRRFLFRVYAPDPAHLTTCVSDFQSTTWHAIQSLHHLHDLRENMGFRGSWPEFLDYLTASIKSDNVRLVQEKRSNSDGSVYAKLVAQKSKGMPLITITLSKLADSDAVEAIAKFSLGLFEAYKFIKESVAKGDRLSYPLKNSISDEQGAGNQTQLLLQSQQNHKDSSTKMFVSSSSSGLDMSQGTQKVGIRDKVTNLVVPAYRRTKKRGAILQDVEEAESA